LAEALNGRTIITAALPYANANLHLGGVASTYLPADILYRYLKLRGRDALHVCASDDFGTPILIAAEKEGKKPSEYVAMWNKKFAGDLRSVGVVYDLFDRTSSPENVELVQSFFTALRERGHIFVSEVDQFYCENDRKFLPDRYVKGKCPFCGAEDQYSDGCESCGRTIQPGQILNPVCSICGTPPVRRKSDHYFFRLSAFSKELEEWLRGNENLQPDAKNYVLNWIKDGLQDWDITRDLEWGVPIPLKEARGKVLYGWFDNHLCYITMALKVAKERGREGEEEKKDFWNESTICHFIGKDIVYHHYLFLPSMRMGEGTYRLPDFIPTRGHLLLGGRKISKSRHWSITIADFLKVFPPDYLRFYLSRIVPYSQSDADFSWEEFREKINNELVASIGNFVYRSLVFVKNKHGNVVPEPGEPGAEEREVLEELRIATEAVDWMMEQGHYDRALKRILDFSSRCNQYFQHRAPWEGKGNEPTTIFYSCNLVAALALLLHPFLPFSSAEIWLQLGFREQLTTHGWDSLQGLNVKAGQRIGELKPLYKKVEDEQLEGAEKLLG
jgi:methionyl-tRNA synthetase